MDISSLLATLHLGQIQANWTTFVFLFFLVILFFYFGMNLGRIATTVMSVYISLAIVNSISYFRPDGPLFGVGGMFAVKLASFLFIIVIVLLLVSRVAVKSLLDIDKAGNFFERLLFSILAAGMLTTAIVSFLPDPLVGKLAPLAVKMFASNLAMFLWLVLPLFAMLLVKEDEQEDDKHH